MLGYTHMGKNAGKKTKVIKGAVDNKRTVGANLFFWVLALALLGSAVYFDHYYFEPQQGVAVKLGLTSMKAFLLQCGRFVSWLVLALLLAMLLVKTNQGSVAWGNLKKARKEMARVTWPTRSETVQMSLIVVVIVLLMALFLFLVDWLFAAAVGKFF